MSAPRDEIARFVEVKIGGLKFRAPAMGTRENTLRVAESVEARIHDIEARTGNPDSYDVALMTAMSFAAEAEAVTRAHAEDQEKTREKEEGENRELLVALKKVSDSLRALVDQMQEGRVGS